MLSVKLGNVGTLENFETHITTFQETFTKMSNVNIGRELCLPARERRNVFHRSPSLQKLWFCFKFGYIDPSRKVFRALEDMDCNQSPTVACYRHSKDGSTSSASTVMDTRPLIKNKSPGHIVKPISPTDEQALDTAIHMAKEYASRSLQDQGDSSPVATPTRKNGPRFFIFHSKHHHHHHEKKHFSEMLSDSKNLQEALPSEVNDVYKAIIENGDFTCSMDDDSSKESAVDKVHYSTLRPSSDIDGVPSIPPPLPPKPAARPNPNTLKHHRRIHPLVLPGISSSTGNLLLDNNNNNNTNTLPMSKSTQFDIGRPLSAAPTPMSTQSLNLPRSRRHPSNSSYSSGGSDPPPAPEETIPTGGETREIEYCDLSHHPVTVEAATLPSNFRGGGGGVSDLGVKPKKKLDRHVSCEDLLDFSWDRAAAKRTQGRERGLDSDEVHIMQKVLANENLSSEDCLAALNVAEWNVHKAIKLARLRLLLSKSSAVVTDIPFQDTKSVLETTNWNLDQAVQAIRGHV